MSDGNPTSGTHTLVEKVRLERWSYVSVNIEVNVRGHHNGGLEIHNYHTNHIIQVKTKVI